MVNKKSLIIFFIIIFFNYDLLFAENFTLTGFVDSYVANSSNDIKGSDRNYLTQPVRNNQFRPNLISLGVLYEDSVFRVKFTGQLGDSVNVNYNSEPEDAFKYLQEGYVGYSINENTKLDAGVFLSHIGAESWISKDNINYTRSFIAEFSPYYESGLKLSHKFNSRLNGQFLILNGWQNISDERHPALGTQLSYQDGDIVLTHNTFLGDENKSTRIFNDFIVSYKPVNYYEILASVDYGYQTLDTNSWWGYSVMQKYSITNEISFNTRFEYYSDPEHVIVSTPNEDDFKSYALTLGARYEILSNFAIRADARYLWSKNKVFQNDVGLNKDDVILVISFNIFEERKF